MSLFCAPVTSSVKWDINSLYHIEFLWGKKATRNSDITLGGSHLSFSLQLVSFFFFLCSLTFFALQSHKRKWLPTTPQYIRPVRTRIFESQFLTLGRENAIGLVWVSVHHWAIQVGGEEKYLVKCGLAGPPLRVAGAPHGVRRIVSWPDIPKGTHCNCG